jgi:F-type H+-transporting ATPase subunit a
MVENGVVFTVNFLGQSWNATVYGLFLLGICVALMLALSLIARLKSGRLKTFIEAFVCFVREDIVVPNLGEEGKKFVPFFCTLLIFLLFANYLGFIPQMHTITANLSVTLGMALVSGALIIGLSLKANGPVGFLKTFVPGGVPAYLVPLIFPLEVASLFIRIFVLAIRLFANMAAGHMVLIGLFAFIFLMGNNSLLAGYITSVPVLVMTLFVTVLELLVAAIQAYVFTLLTAIFTGLQMHAH